MEDIYKKSLELHKKHKGKISIELKMPLETKEDLSLAYSPGVAEASRQIGANPEAVFDYTTKGNMVAVVSDGSAILGLGNLGAKAAIPVMEGKAALFKKFAGIDAFPICLNTQDTEEIIQIVKNITPVFGAINLEDISAPRCFEIEERLRREADVPVMHDDQHGTSVVVLAGLINALKLRGSKKEEVKVVVNGAGAAGIAIAKILLEYGFQNVIMADSKGAIYEGRENLDGIKKNLAEKTNKGKISGDLAKIMHGADVFIGVSKAKLVTGEMVKTMAKDPIIFALANPEPEIGVEEAKAAGALIVATGRSDFPNQVNNALAFPGIFRGALDNKIKQFETKMFIKAAEVLAGAVENPSPEKIIPTPFEKGVVEKIAAVMN
ncbi:MAG TPA: NADP-dependent malic enzyme [Candidatus Paceibacterota bacterium]